MMKKQRLLTLVLSCACVFTCAVAVGTWSLDTEKANAAWTNDGGVDHYTDMTSNGEDLEYYDTLYNEDWTLYNGSNQSLGAMPKEWTIANDQYMRFTPSASNTTGSFVWKYTYTCTDASTGFYVYPLSGGAWNGAQFLDYHSCGFEAGKTYDVEFGSVKVKNNTNYYVYIKVDGVFKMGTYRGEGERKGNDLYFYITGGAGKATSQKPEVKYEYEDYVVVQNDDFGGAATLSWGGDATNGLTLSNGLPTASFVYKFHYTPGGGDTALALRSSYWGSYHFLFRGKTLMYNLNASYVTVGEVFTDGTQLVEVGCIEIKNSDLTWFFLKVNGEEKMSATAANVPDEKSISAWGDETAVFAQYSWKVDFKSETKEIVSGEAIGELPSAPESEYEFIGWADQYGNILTAETVVVENLTATPVFNEPHTVTFVVNGKTLTTVENVGYQETVTLPECNVPGYDFVKWVYGDNEEFTAETQVVSNLTVTAVLTSRDFTEDELADYITVTNKDIGAAASIKNTNSSFANYEIVTENETSSVVYRFVYAKGEKPLYMVVRDVINGWGTNADGSAASGYIFILNGATLETPVSAPITEAFAGENGLYLVEIGVIDVKGSSEVWIYVNVNGNKIVDGRMEKRANVSNYIDMFGDDASTSTINEADDYHFLEGVVEKHTVVEVEGLAATCTEAGYTAYSYCEICKADIVAKEILDALGHEEETVKGYAATCTETGLTDGCVCTVCEEVLVDQTEIGVLGHDLQTVDAVAPDCEMVGATAGERCIREGCGVIVSGCEEVPATGHTAVVDEAIASTCIERGKTEGSHCGTCGKTLQEQESLPLAEHTYENGVCTVCGDEDGYFVEPEDSSNDSSTDEKNSSSGANGCFGSVGGVASGIITAISAAFICVKKKKEKNNLK